MGKAEKLCGGRTDEALFRVFLAFKAKKVCGGRTGEALLMVLKVFSERPHYWGRTGETYTQSVIKRQSISVCGSFAWGWIG